MKQIQTLIWCDLCYGSDESQEEATHRDVTVTIGLGARTKPHSLDLCERHFKELIEPLQAALQEFGVVVPEAAGAAPKKHRPAGEAATGRKTAVPGEGPFRCELCDSTLVSMGSFGSHVRQIHSMTLGEYRETYGAPVEVPADPDLFNDVNNMGPAEATCEICGESWSHANGNTRPAQARGVHMRRKHGVKTEGRARDRRKAGA